MFRVKKAQSTLEYVIVLTAIIGVIIWAAAQLIKPAVNTSYTNVKESIENTAGKLSEIK